MNKNGHRYWPFERDKKYLPDHNSSTWCALNWLSGINIDDSFFAQAFKDAGDKIIVFLSATNDERQHPDKYFMPITFLYRHSLELKLKEMIRIGLKLKYEDEDSILKDHSLHCLWNFVKALLCEYWPDSPREELSGVESVIMAFHKVDPTGQNLRYSRDTKNNKTTLSFPDSVELLDLKQIVTSVFEFLDGCQMGLHYELEMRQEYGREY